MEDGAIQQLTLVNETSIIPNPMHKKNVAEYDQYNNRQSGMSIRSTDTVVIIRYLSSKDLIYIQ